MITVNNLHKIYGQGSTATHALKGVSLDIQPGEFVAIMGHSGSGKSTIMNILGCLDKPTEGKVFIEDHDIITLSPDQLADVRNQHIGFVFQSFNLIPVLTAFENVEFPLILLKGMSSALRKARVMNLLEQVGIDELAN